MEVIKSESKSHICYGDKCYICNQEKLKSMGNVDKKEKKFEVEDFNGNIIMATFEEYAIIGMFKGMLDITSHGGTYMHKKFKEIDEMPIHK